MSCWYQELDNYDQLWENLIILTGIYKNTQEFAAVIKLYELTHVETLKAWSWENSPLLFRLQI